MDSESPVTGTERDGAARESVGLWREAQVGTRRLPDPVRVSAVRAGIVVAVALIVVMVAVMAAISGTWFVGPAMIAAIAASVAAAWSALDVAVTRQSFTQRAGVVSGPSSAARELRRERRAVRRAERRSARRTERGERAAGGRRHVVSRA